MKNKFLKFSIVLILCLVIFSGCVVVPSLTPEATPSPTPLDPTPTPIPYGEILDITVACPRFVSRGPNDKITESMEKILLEKFSLRITEYKDYCEGCDAELILYPYSLEIDSGDLDDFRKDIAWASANIYNGIDYTEYFHKMPNYTSLFYNWEQFYSAYNKESDCYSLAVTGRAPLAADFWIYNKTWFRNTGNEVPKDINALVDMLIEYKKTNPEARPIFIPRQRDTENNSSKYSDLVKGVFAAYGLDFSQSMLTDAININNGELVFAADDPKITQALDTVKRIIDNGLVGDVGDEYYFSGNGLDYTMDIPLNDFAVTYAGNNCSGNGVWVFWNILYQKGNWIAVENQFSAVGDTPYLDTEYIISSNDYYGFSPSHIIIPNSASKEVIDRLIDYLDWCCTEEGILAHKLGIEGEDYVINKDSTITLLKDKEDIEPAAFGLTTIYYEYAVLSKYVDIRSVFSDDENIQWRICDFIQKSFGSAKPEAIYFEEMIDVFSEYEGKSDTSRAIKDVIKSFCEDYINGIKTAEDFEEYITDLEEAGLSDFLDGIKEYRNNLYEECKDSLPDTLK